GCGRPGHAFLLRQCVAIEGQWWQCRARPMTESKAPDQEEVGRVYVALAKAYIVHRGLKVTVEMLDVPKLQPPVPRLAKARALHEPVRLAWCANARFLRAAASKMPADVTDDSVREQV